MDIDWPLVFTGVKTVLDPISNASWPIAVGVISWLIRHQVRELIGRVKQLSGFGGTADFASQDAPSQRLLAEESSPRGLQELSDTTARPLPDPVFDKLDREFAAELEKHVRGGDDIKLAWAIRQRSVSEAARNHESNYRIMFGSQINCLKSLNTYDWGSLSDIQAFYSTIKSHPSWESMHKDRSFDSWIGFLIATGYIEFMSKNGESGVALLPFGKQFLQWMVLAGVPELKPG